MKQAAVDLLGAHVSMSRDLALTYFDTVTAATRDASTSVRKSALKILWESCISVPGFSRASEACVHVLNRISDPEESIQDLVAKVFHALWFACKPEPGAPLTPEPHSGVLGMWIRPHRTQWRHVLHTALQS